MINYKKFVIKLCALLLILSFIFGFSASAEDTYKVIASGTITCSNSDKAYAIYFYNVTNEKALFEQNIDKLISPASTVKMMTALVALDSINDTTKSVTITKAMIDGITTHNMKLQVGEVISIEHLLTALVCSGYNDAAQALAVISCGSVSSFVDKMNKKAASLGAVNTVYKETTGVDDSAQTTAFDTMLIAKEFLSNEKLSKLSSLPSFVIPSTNVSDERHIYNRNALKSSYTGSKYLNANAIGMNAGMTSGAGYCVVTGIENGGNTYICVVMGAKASAETDTIYSYVVANELLGQISRLSMRTLFTKKDIVGELKIEGASINVENASVCPSDDVTAFLPAEYETSGKLKCSYIYSTETLVAPVKSGEKVGKIIVSYDGEIVSTCDLVVAKDIEREFIIYVLFLIKSFLTNRLFIFILISVVCLILIRQAVINKKSRRHGRRSVRYK